MADATLAAPQDRRHDRVDKAMGWLRIGLGVLWLVDGVLQMQPGMFTMDMVSDIMAPAATAQPPWLARLIDWSVRVVTPHLVPFNWSVVGLQLLIGLLLLSPRRRHQRVGLLLSLLWGTAVWLFGEGLGQILTGSATALTGAPGSAFYYALFSAFLLLPCSTARRLFTARRDPLVWTAAGSLFLTAALQLAGPFWTPLGLAAPFGDAAMMPQPGWLRATVEWAGSLAAHHPGAVNLALVATSAALGLALLVLPDRAGPKALAFAFFFLVWWFGQDFGMLSSGMATDPNSAPLLLLALAVSWAKVRAPRLVSRTAGVLRRA